MASACCRTAARILRCAELSSSSNGAASAAARISASRGEKLRDVTYGEDASQTRTGNGPQVMAMLRNLSIAIMKMAGHHNIAAATRYHALDAAWTLAILGISPA